MKNDYEENGYIHIPSLFSEDALEDVRAVLEDFHNKWLKDNQDLFENQVLNSSGVTGLKYLDLESRLCLFNFISSSSIMGLIKSVIPSDPCFVNTQLFFNPKNVAQKNYWHRDPQYHLTLPEQEKALSGPNMLHIRIPMKNERGIEVMPGTHCRWDTPEELDVRLEDKGRRNYNDLSGSQIIPLNAGDALLFSANMIHRGLYGMERLALDILVCDPDTSLLKFAQEDHLPSEELKQNIANPALYNNTLLLKQDL